MMRAKIYSAVGLKRVIGLFVSTAVLLSAGCTDGVIPDISGGEDEPHSQPQEGAIEFKDSSVEEILLQHGVDANGDGAISRDEAAAVKSVETWFKESAIRSFDEFEYFTGVTSVAQDAFLRCGSLASITIPDGVTVIGNGAFYECGSLTGITIPDAVTKIEEMAFYYCGSLTNITIPESVTEIGEAAFCGCGSLEKFEGKFASADNRCLIVDGLLTAFAPAGATQYTVPDGVTEIGTESFYECTNLASITIPDSVTTIGEWAFWHCSALKSVTIGNGVTEIGCNAFMYCSSLESVTIPDSVTKIGGYAFNNCTGLTSMTISAGVTSIGEYAFAFCSGLASVYCKPATPPALSDGVFNNVSSSAKIYVPTASVEAYKAATNWSEYANLIVGYDF